MNKNRWWVIYDPSGYLYSRQLYVSRNSAAAEIEYHKETPWKKLFAKGYRVAQVVLFPKGSLDFLGREHAQTRKAVEVLTTALDRLLLDGNSRDPNYRKLARTIAETALKEAKLLVEGSECRPRHETS